VIAVYVLASIALLGGFAAEFIAVKIGCERKGRRA
jgi:hypothetical protein